MKNIILILALLLASNSVQAQTGSQKSAAALSSEVNALLPTNGQNEINAYSLRQIEQDIIASTIGAGGLPLVLGSTQLLGATQGFVLYDNNGTLGNLSATTTFNGTPCVLGSACSVSTSPQFNAKASPYNATGNGLADDTAALQACITAAETAGNTCYIPAGQYKITTTLSIITHVSIKGDGYQGIGNACIGNVGGCIQLTSTNVGRATTIEPSSTITAFTVTADDSVSFSDFQIVYLTSPTLGSGIAGISLKPTTGSSSNNGFATTLDRVMIAQSDVGLLVSDIYAWNVGNSVFYNNLTHGIQVTGVNFLPDGDWDVHDSMFIGGYTNGTPNYQDHLFIQTTCGRVVNNKFNSLGSTWATYGIHIQPIASATIEPCHFIGNSLEGLNDGIFLDGSGTPTTGRMNQWLINDNQFYGGSTTSTASFTGSISGTTLTVSGVTGTIFPGMAITTGSGVAPGTFIASGSGTSWTVNNSQSVGSEAMIASVPDACIYSTPDAANTAWATAGTIANNFCTIQLNAGTKVGFDLDGVGIIGITGNQFGPNGAGTGTGCSFGSHTSEIAHSGNSGDIADGVSLGDCGGNWTAYNSTPTPSSGAFGGSGTSVSASYVLNEKTLSFTAALTVTNVGSATGNINLTLPTGMTANGYFILPSADVTTATSYVGVILNGGSSFIIGTTTISNDSYVISGTIQIN